MLCISLLFACEFLTGSRSPTQGSQEIAEGVTGLLQHAAYGGVSAGLRLRWRVCIWLRQHQSQHLPSWEPGLQEQTLPQRVSWGQHAGRAGWRGCSCTAVTRKCRVKNCCYNKNYSHSFSKWSWVIWWAWHQLWVYALEGYWYHRAACVWLLLFCGFSCLIFLI